MNATQPTIATRPVPLTVLALLSAVTGCFAQGTDLTGIAAHRAALGASAASGAGVVVSQVESAVSGAYLPQSSAGAATSFAGAGMLEGMTLTPVVGASEASSHAATVASVLFGQADGVTQSLHYSASQWMYRAQIKPVSPVGLVLEPKADGAVVQNHSWISSGAGVGNNDLLRRVDFLAERDGVTIVAGTSNGQSTNVPQLLASAYNTITVGLVNGNHGAGFVSATGSDGMGRQKPDLVAPADYVSYAAPQVSAAAAQVIEFAKRSEGTAVAVRPETVKAILLAGATTAGLSRWTSTPEQPLDPRFGAGTVNVNESINILAEATTSVGATKGWALETATTTTRTLTIPEGRTGLEFKAALTWHRVIKDGPTNGFDPVPEILANFRLELRNSDTQILIAQSDSALDNVELIATANLPAGRYTLSVTGDKAARFGLAWRTTLSAPVSPAPTPVVVAPVVPELSVVLINQGKAAKLTLSQLKAGKSYTLQCSTDLKNWKATQVFTAPSTTLAVNFAVTEAMSFCSYRLVATNGTF
jgi:Subtilase family